MSLRPSLVILTLLLCGWLPGAASALPDGRVSGGLLFGTGQYRAEVDGVEAQKITTSYEQVGLRYNVDGLLGDARIGRYTLMLGYEFNVIDPSVSNYGVKDPEVEKITAKKLFYEGSILVAPGGLPFRLSAYARDLHQTTFAKDGSLSRLPVGAQSQDRPTLLDPAIFTGIDNGTHRELGVTLLLGIRNGSYLGAYRDVLSQLPRLLIDFKQNETRDLSRDFSMVHTRSRDLAFVSLNKKDNWVHLRMRDFVDYLNPDNNSNQSQVMIGTIDQLLQRKWINLTNWIKISGDLSYNVEVKATDPDPERTYRLNLMAVSKRETVSTSIFSQFNRLNDGRQLVLDAELPIIVAAEISRDTQLRSRFIYAGSERSLLSGRMALSNTGNDDFANVQLESQQNCYLDTQLELQRSRRVIIKPRFELESLRNAKVRDGLAVKVGSEILSNSHLNSSFNWLGGYALTATRTNDAVLATGSSYLQNEIYGRADKDLTRNLRIGGISSLAVGSGKGKDALIFRIPVMSSKLQGGGGSSRDLVNDSIESTTINGLLALYLEHRYEQLENRLGADYNFITTAGVTAEQSSLRHSLYYSAIKQRLLWASTLNIGDNSGAPATINNDYLKTDTNNSSKMSWNSKASYYYDPNRSTGLTLIGAISGAAQSTSYALSEEMVYRIFTVNGIIRRLAEFSEEIGYQKAGFTVDGRNETLFGHFAAAYFPTKFLYGKLRSEIGGFLNSSALQQVYIGEVGLDFEKLKLLASYSQGQKDRESANLPEILEQRWELKVKKIF